MWDFIILLIIWREFYFILVFCRYRSKKQLSTVGSPFWMAPEVIVGQNYNELVMSPILASMKF